MNLSSPRMRAVLLALLVAATMASSGCSYLFVTPPHETYGGRVENCTTNRAAPVIDTIFVGTNVISAIYVASENNVTNKGSAVGLGLGVAAIWLSSAIYGYYNTSQCEELMSEDARPFYPPPRPVRRPVWRQPPPPAAAPPPGGPPPLPPPDWAPATPPPPAAAPPADGAAAAPAPPAPATPQQPDSDDPRAHHGGGAGRPDMTPRFGN